MLDFIERTMNQYPQLTYTFHPFPNDKSGGAISDKDVFINSNLSKRKQYQTLHEEIAHYETTVGDISAEDTIEKRQQEHVARARSMERLVNLDGLIYCAVHQINKNDDIADYFNVEIDYLYEALCHWKEKLGVNFCYRGYLFDFSCGLQIVKI